jgi:hypothetical protein
LRSLDGLYVSSEKKRKERAEAEEDVQGYMMVSGVGRIATVSSSSDWPLLEAHKVINRLTELEISKRDTHALVAQAARRTVKLRISSCIHGDSGRITTSSRGGRGTAKAKARETKSNSWILVLSDSRDLR